jgi:hypothetical protein
MGIRIGVTTVQQQNEAALFYQEQEEQNQRSGNNEPHRDSGFIGLIGFVVIAMSILVYVALHQIYLLFSSWVTQVFDWLPF